MKNLRRPLATIIGILALIFLSVLAWEAAALHVTLSAGLCLLLGLSLLGTGVLSLFFLIYKPTTSLAARLLLLAGPTIGCSSIGLALTLMVASPKSGLTIYLFAVGIVAFQVAAVDAIFVGIARHKTLNQLRRPSKETGPA